MDNELTQSLPEKSDAEIFIGPRSSFYLEKWERYPLVTNKGWNWPAMLFTYQWLAYRKMYVEAAILCAVTLLVPMPLQFGLIFINFGIFNLLMGLFGNYIYWRKTVRVLAKSKNMEDEKREKYLKSKGGINIPGILLFNIAAGISVFVINNW